jgi:hypothetical protein
MAQCISKWVVVAAVTFLSHNAAPANEGSPLFTVEARLDDATLVAADAGWKWTFKVGEVEHAVAARGVVRYGNYVRPSGQHRLRLASGEEIVGYSIEVSDDQVVLESDLLEAVKAPAKSTAAVIFDMPTDEHSARLIDQRIAAAPENQETLLFANGDQLVGRLVKLAADTATFASADREFSVERSRLSAIVFQRAPARPLVERTFATWIGLRDGSRMLARAFLVRDGRATIEMASGVTVAVARERIVALQPVGGETVYLSDLDDAGYRHIPFLSIPWGYHRDRNVTGSPLVVGGRLYLKGIGMHSAARITYDLDADYRRFQADLAIDDSTGGRGSVTCRVFTDDGSGEWQMKFDSPIVRGGEKPLAVDVDASGAKRISLLVDFSDRGDELDHINWLDARLIK